MSALRAAFSLRRNVRALLVPARGQLPALDGVRALAILWVISCHSIWSRGLGKYPRYVYRGMVSSPDPILRVLLRGDLGVNLFFSLSGFLIGTILLEELLRTGSPSFGRFYLRRYLRLTPVYVAVIGIFCALPGFPNEAGAWANLLYVNDFVPATERRFMGWTWSLAVEEQFYLTMPLLLLLLLLFRYKRRIVADLAA